MAFPGPASIVGFPPVRPFVRDDIPEVARLWMKVFRHSEGPVPQSLTRYFEELFFHSPLRGEGMPSLVCRGTGGRLIGFLGVLCRRMTFRGDPLRVAVSTQFMVDPDARDPAAALQLMRALFSGPQDLTYTDGSNDISTKLWEYAGGQLVPLKSLEWVRVLRHGGLVADILGQRKGIGPAAHALRPVCSLLDSAASRLKFGPSRLPRSSLVAETATSQTLLECIDAFTASHSLRPAYDPDSMKWLLESAAMKTASGTLQPIVLRDHAGRLAGSCLYYLTPSGTSHVLQLTARRDARGGVLDYLFRDAWRNGSLAVRGQLEPDLLIEMSDRFCRFRCYAPGVLVHSARPELLLAVHRGDAYLSRLEGEWWLRFGGDKFI